MDQLTVLGRRGVVLALAGALALLAACAEAPVAPGQPVEIPVFPPAPGTPRFYWERALYSSADVVPDDDEGRLRRLLTGEVRSGEGLAKPYGIAAHRGRIYVSDTVERAVLMFDLVQRRFKRIGLEGAGALRSPFGLDTDADGNLYVVDGTLRRVLVYDAEGNHRQTFGADLKLSRPAGIAVDRARRRIYIVDVGGVESEEHRVRAIDLDSGRPLFDIGKRGEGPGEFNLPRDAVVGPDGEIYVVDGGNFRVQVFDHTGKFIKTFGAVGRQGGQFSRPKEIAVDSAGNVYVVDTAFGNFQIFDREGRLLLDVGGRSNTDAPARFMLPSGIAVDVDGRVYMVDQFFRKIDVFRPADLPAGAAFGQARPPAAK